MHTAFLIFALLTIVSGLAAVSLRNVVHCILSLIGFFAGIAAIFFTLHAEFLGAVQLIIYVGAIAVLLLFTIMLTRGVMGNEGEGAKSPFTGGAGWGIFASLAILAAIGSVLPGASDVPPVSTPNTIAVADLGRVLMTRFAVPFEVISLLLTTALVGAVVLAVEEPRPDKDPKVGNKE